MGRVTIPLSLSSWLTIVRNILLMSPCMMVTACAFLVVGSRPNRNPPSCFSHPITASTVSSSGIHCALYHSQARLIQQQNDHGPTVCRRNSSEDRFTCLFRTRLFNGASPNNKDAELLEQLLGGLLTEDTEEKNIKGKNIIENTKQTKARTTKATTTPPSPLERALLQGVVPADAGVGSGCLPGDYGFDPLNVATKDYFRQVQTFLLKFLNWGDSDDNEDEEQDKNEEAMIADVGAAMPKRGFVGNNDQGARPPALILRDYHEVEIRHGRLAMLAALFWPLQEILDRMFLPESFGSTTVIYGGTTLPYLTLIMTLFMTLL
eukprot:scaffold17451_cov51-Attheya_sp.AAC.1